MVRIQRDQERLGRKLPSTELVVRQSISNRHVDFPRTQRGELGVHPHLPHSNVDIRISGTERLYDLRDELNSGCAVEAHGNMTQFSSARPLGGKFRKLELPKTVLGFMEKHLPCGGERQLASRSLNENRSQFLFKLLNILTQS